MTKEYAILTSGHGSPFRYSGLDPDHPTILLDKEEAFRKATWWNGIADTIGGVALVEHIPSGRRYEAWGGEVTSGVQLHD